MKTRLMFSVLCLIFTVVSAYYIMFEDDYIRGIYFLLIANFIKD